MSTVILGGDYKKDILLANNGTAVGLAISQDGKILSEIIFTTPASMEHLSQMLHTMASNWKPERDDDD